MKLGVESRNKTIAAVLLAAVAIFLFWHSFFSGGGVESPPPAPAQLGNAAVPNPRPTGKDRTARQRASKNAQPEENPLDPRLRLALLKSSEETEYQGAGRNIFRAEAEPVIPKALDNGLKKEAARTPPLPPKPIIPPGPPPIPLKFFGFANRTGTKSVFLSKGDEVFVAKEGDVVDRQYKVVKINTNSVEIEDLFSNNRQTVPLTAGQS
jgi:hypothetical protein